MATKAGRWNRSPPAPARQTEKLRHRGVLVKALELFWKNGLLDPVGLYDPYGLWVWTSLPQWVVDTVGAFAGNSTLSDQRDLAVPPSTHRPTEGGRKCTNVDRAVGADSLICIKIVFAAHRGGGPLAGSPGNRLRSRGRGFRSSEPWVNPDRHRRKILRNQSIAHL